MKVSVLVTTYNHENYIEQAIDSILMQRVNFDCEIIIGEDCSTDQTRDLVIDYQKANPERIRLFLAEKNLGSSGNLIFEKIFRIAQGDYIAILDGDDYWTDPNKLQKQVDFLDNHSECAVCFHAVRVFYEDRNQDSWISGSKKEISTLEDLLEANFIQTCSIMFRRGLIDSFPDWYKNSQIGDWELLIFNAQHGYIGYIDEVMGAYRRHSGGVYTSSDRVSRLNAMITMYKNINAYLEHQYHKTIKMMISKCCYELALEYEKKGIMISARDCIAKSIRGYLF